VVTFAVKGPLGKSTNSIVPVAAEAAPAQA
jgi:hypothetical protein